MKNKTMYVCDECGYESAKWLGKCPACGGWNTLAEFQEATAPVTRGVAPVSVRGQAGAQALSQIEMEDEIRFVTGMEEMDRVLGGGAVKGSFLLVGGEPGIGKSTLLLQMCQQMSRQAKILYVSGEESLRQIKLRANRLGVSAENIHVLAETELTAIFHQCDAVAPEILMVDSIQTIYKGDLPSAPGNATQVKECAMALMQYAKRSNITIFIVGHVNKDGAIAGPKMLEHMVDCVLYFEGEKHLSYRLLRAVKNRYGSTNEISMFEMTDRGLRQVHNPSEMLLAGHVETASGNCIVATMEGSRPILAEIQALVTKTSFGVPRRMSAGLDYNRMVLLLAILEKRAGLALGGVDVYLNVAGGLRVDEPAVDLAAVLAVVSSFREKAVKPGLVAFGEIGLSGEIRAVSAMQQRVAEAARLGFTRCLVPEQRGEWNAPAGMEIIPVQHIVQALQMAL